MKVEIEEIDKYRNDITFWAESKEEVDILDKLYGKALSIKPYKTWCSIYLSSYVPKVIKNNFIDNDIKE